MPATAAQDEGKTMKKLKLDRLVASLGEVRDHVATGRFAGRITKLDSAARSNRAGRGRKIEGFVVARLRTHPGEVLREEYLIPLGLSARACKVARRPGEPGNRDHARRA
jgi:hypothetical protein